MRPKTKLNQILDLIDLRIQDTNKELAAAVAAQLWSYTPHFDGVVCGLLIASNIIKKFNKNVKK